MRFRLPPALGARTLTAGLFDAGLASLATFAVGLSAVWLFSPAELGVYALVFSAFNLVAVLPRDLFFSPLEIHAVTLPRAGRLPALGRGLLLGVPLALFCAATLLLWVPLAPGGIPREAAVALAVTGAACAFLSPVQDHVRRALHLAGDSWIAARVSLVQLLGAATALAVGWWLEVPAWWLPLGSLAAANLLSSAAGLLLAPGWRRTGPESGSTLSAARRTGGWLLLMGLAGPAMGFAVHWLVTYLAGAAALGYAEAARMAGQPILVAGLGLAATLGPRSMEAASAGQRDRARRISRGFAAIIGVVALGYLLCFGIPWRLNPLLWLVPPAFAVAWLLPAVVVATAANGALLPVRSELLGLGRAKAAASVDVLGGLAGIALGATAAWTHSFAVPLGLLGLAAVRWVGYRAVLGRVYLPRRPAAPTALEVLPEAT